jgi:exopolysaccharide biosynthesis polyprenyl glycosylphosphotransferase
MSDSDRSHRLDSRSREGGVIQELDSELKTVAERVAARATSPQLARKPSRDFILRRLLVAADLTGIVGALALATIFFGVGDALPKLVWGLVTLPGWILLFKIYGLYDRDGKRVSHSTVDDIPWIFHTLLLGSLGLWLLFKYSPPHNLIFTEGLVFFGVALVGICVARVAVRALSRWLIAPERVLFVGGGAMAEVLARKLRLHPEYELEPIGYVDVSETPGDGFPRSLPYLGVSGEIDEICKREAVERLVIVSSDVDPEELADLIRRLRGLDLRFGILPRAADVIGPSAEVDDIEGITILGITPPNLTRSSRFLKRSMDLAVAAILLLLLSPLMALIALAIRLTSRGPVFHRQERIGERERRFEIYKFRTMNKDADKDARELAKDSAHPAWLLLEDDPRVTRVGRLIRHASLDELPQLWNVLLGDMSLVGPRPLIPEEDEHISGWGRRRLDLTPGITGLWQVLGRTSIPFEEMVKLDYLYVTNWSLWQDFRLLFHTLPAVAKRRGVN